MTEPQPCGDPTCDTCLPPRERCPVCGALHAGGQVPFCSLECALAAGAAEPAPDCDLESQPDPGD